MSRRYAAVLVTYGLGRRRDGAGVAHGERRETERESATGSRPMSDVWHVGRKAIIDYLKPYLALSDDTRTAWNMVRRWRVRYWIDTVIIQPLPNGKPALDPAAFEQWWERYKETYAKQAVGREG